MNEGTLTERDREGVYWIEDDKSQECFLCVVVE